MSKGVRFVILGEDSAHLRFCRTILKDLGVHPREISEKIANPGDGAAEYFVRNRFPVELSGLRRKQNSQKVRLIVCIDADRNTLSKRLSDLDIACESYGICPVSERDKLARWVPRRNIETWISFFVGTVEVNELDDFKQNFERAQYNHAARDWIQVFRSTDDVRSACLPSLIHSFSEFERVWVR